MPKDRLKNKGKTLKEKIKYEKKSKSKSKSKSKRPEETQVGADHYPDTMILMHYYQHLRLKTFPIV